jgi:hypothetical protein
MGFGTAKGLQEDRARIPFPPSVTAACTNPCDLECPWVKAATEMHERTHLADAQANPQARDAYCRGTDNGPEVLAVLSCWDYRAHRRSAMMLEEAVALLRQELAKIPGCS